MISPPQRWRLLLPAWLLLAAWTLFWYRDTATAMVEIWWRSETFNHAFMVPLISLWLVWRQRAALARIELRPDWRFAALLAPIGLAWLLGELAAVGAVAQFALVGLLAFSVPALFGARLARAILFPLGFLFFMVPFGEFVMPQFMDWTADFTVWAVSASGIPVYREGLHFVIPSGQWSVVEACSGVRYLIASIVVGALYAYLNYRSTRRRLVFVGFSILVPLVANWVRAYLIVMLGHLSGNELATGADHLVYGWVFFGIVILIMFAVGMRWAEAPAEAASAAETATNPAAASAGGLALVLLTSALLAVAPRLWFAQLERPVPQPAALATATVPGWQATAAPTYDWRPAFHNPSQESRVEYRSGERLAGLYLGYYRGQGYDRKLVSSQNVLVTSQDPRWLRIAQGRREIALDDAPALAVKSAQLRDRATPSVSLLAWRWYWVNGRLTASEAEAKLHIALSRLLGQGDDAAVVVVYAPLDQTADAETPLAEFSRQAWPGIRALLQATRAQR